MLGVVLCRLAAAVASKHCLIGIWSCVCLHNGVMD